VKKINCKTCLVWLNEPYAIRRSLLNISRFHAIPTESPEKKLLKNLGHNNQIIIF
jgi:hypothetical protein